MTLEDWVAFIIAAGLLWGAFCGLILIVWVGLAAVVRRWESHQTRRILEQMADE